MPLTDDDMNRALNTPSDELEDDPQDEPDDQYVDPDDPEEPEDPQDEPEDEPEEEEQDPIDALLGAKPTSSTRKEGRVQRLANERRNAEADAAQARAEAAALRERLAQQDNEAFKRAREEQQRQLEEMDPAERRAFEALNEAREARRAAEDSRDQAEFSRVISSNPALKPLEKEVETELKRARAAGMNPTRESVAKFLLGDRAFKRLQEAPKLKKEAKQRVDNARGRPVGARSDARSDGRERSQSLAKRLEGVKL